MATDGYDEISLNSSPASIPAFGAVPDAPVLSSTVSAGNIHLSWTDPTGNDANTTTSIYEVTDGVVTPLGTSLANFASFPVGSAGSKIFAVFYCSQGTLYPDGAYSLYSNFVNADGSAAVPGAPGNLSATPFNDSTGSGVRLLWDNDSDNESGFTIQRSTSADFFDRFADIHG